MKPNMPVPHGERGAALLTVLLLVAVMAVIAASSLEKLRLATRLSGNSFAVDQARAYASAAETIAAARAERLIERSLARTTLQGGWNGRAIGVPVPGGSASVIVRDGGNCFNLNSVVQGESLFQLTSRIAGIRQFVGLMQALQIPQAPAERIAAATADWIDSDVIPQPNGAEDDFYGGVQPQRRAANMLMSDPSELRQVAGMTPEIYARLRPFICTLPTPDLSPINVNTVLPEQAPLIAMLLPRNLTPDRARTLLAERPATGYGSAQEFLNRAALSAGAQDDGQLGRQLKVRTTWFSLETRVELGGTRVTQRAMIDARTTPVRVTAHLAGRGD